MRRLRQHVVRWHRKSKVRSIETISVFTLFVALTAWVTLMFKVEIVRNWTPKCVDGSIWCALKQFSSAEEFYVLSHSATTPQVDLDTWTLTISGQVSKTVVLTMDQLQAMPSAGKKQHTMECIGATNTWRAIDNGIWDGITLQGLLADLEIEVLDTVSEIQYFCSDDFIPWIEYEKGKSAWLMWAYQGEPLLPKHGFPLRALTPDHYGVKNAKWIERIHFATKHEHIPDIFEMNGWPTDGRIRPAGFFHRPINNDFVHFEDEGKLYDGNDMFRKHQRSVIFEGSAFCGTSKVDTVELSFDNSTPWWSVDFAYDRPDLEDVWTLWRFDKEYFSKGTHDVLLRVKCMPDNAGIVRSTNTTWTNDMGGWAGYGTLKFTLQ